MMLAVEGKMEAHQALSDGDKWRVARFLAQGKAPSDPRMATAVIESAESYRGRGRVYSEAIRWTPIITGLFLFAMTIPGAIKGDTANTILLVLVVFGCVMQLMFNPAVRPKNVARSLEASRRVVASGGSSASGEDAGPIGSLSH
jgi:hypothetical protein